MSAVSVIIPTFDRPHLLPRAVESAKKAGRDVEVVVVDDASRDGTAKVCASLSGIRHVRVDRNQGVAGARNIGLLESTSDYVAFLDDDDVRLPGSLDHQLSLLKAKPDAGFVAGAVILADPDLVPTGQIAVPRAKTADLFWQVIELELHLLPASVLVRKDSFLEVGLFNQHLAGIDDWDMWTRIVAVRPIIVDELPVCIYRQSAPSSGQGSSQLAPHLYAALKHQPHLLSLARAQAASPEVRRAIRKETRRRIADTLTWRAAEQLPRGALRFAAANFVTALRVSPQWAARPTHLGVLWKSAANRLAKRNQQ